MKIKVSNDVKELLELLNQHGVDYLVCGDHAVAFHGYPRLTMDFDILVRPEPENAKRLMNALRDFGFGSAGIPLDAFLKPGAAVTLGAQPNQVDLLTSISSQPAAALFANAVSGEIEGVPARFVGRSDLIAAKKEANRPKDLADVAELEKAKGDIP